MNNKTFPLGGIVIIDRVEKEFGLFSKIFDGIGGNMKNFIPLVKVHVNNRLTHSVATHQILETYPIEANEKAWDKRKDFRKNIIQSAGANWKILSHIT